VLCEWRKRKKGKGKGTLMRTVKKGRAVKGEALKGAAYNLVACGCLTTERGHSIMNHTVM
jgi:hypothetical protein